MTNATQLDVVAPCVYSGCSVSGSLISPSQLTTWTVSGSSVTKSTGSCLALRVSSKDDAILTTVPCNKTLGFLCQYGMQKENLLFKIWFFVIMVGGSVSTACCKGI